MISVPSSPLSAVRLVAPHSLQVLHIETQRCNISWKLSQASHYVEPYLEFEARRRLLGHSWQVRNGLCTFLLWCISSSVSTCWGAADSAWSSDMAGRCLLCPCFYCLELPLPPHLCSPQGETACETWQPRFHILNVSPGCREWGGRGDDGD